MFYDDMMEFMEKTMDQKGSGMSKDERVLIHTACKSIIDPEFRLMQTIEAIESFSKFESKQPWLDEYKQRVRERIDEKCTYYIGMIQRNVLDSTEKGDDD